MAAVEIGTFGDKLSLLQPEYEDVFACEELVDRRGANAGRRKIFPTQPGRGELLIQVHVAGVKLSLIILR